MNDEINNEIDFEIINKFFEYSEYVAPKKAGLRKQEMLNLSKIGKRGREEFIKFSEKIVGALDGYKAFKCNQWQNSGNLAKYFWIEFKKNDAEFYPHSISILINKDLERNKEKRLNISLRVETRDKISKDKDYYFHNQLIDIPIDSNSNIYYQFTLEDGTEFDVSCDNKEELMNFKNNGFKKIKVVININGPYKKSNSENIISESIKAAKELIPFYEYIIEQRFENSEVDNDISEGKNSMKVVDKYKKYLESTKNLILRGAPGTGKTYLANEIAANIVSEGRTNKKEDLTDEEKARIGFVQFHPSYDYTDFVEGLRPTTLANGGVGFELRAGSFKSFVERAIREKDIIGNDNFADCWERLINAINESEGTYKMVGTNVEIMLNSQNNIKFRSPVATKENVYELYLNGTTKLKYEHYHKIVLDHLFEKYGLNKIEKVAKDNNLKKYIFIIDEINRGEISKIFGELFYSIDPGYRGEKEGVFTQYANLHSNPEEKFYIPDNVYVIGTMNDIDRSVDSFDFAMRRRFTFLEVTAEQSAEAMGIEGEARAAMDRLNESIVNKNEGGLTTDYQIGASYFKDVTDLEALWNFKLLPLLKDYFRGERNAEDKLTILENSYFGHGESDE